MKWCNDKEVREVLPASPQVVALYLADMSDECRSVSKVNALCYSIKWAHKFCGLADPTNNSFPMTILEGAKRSVVPNRRFKAVVTTEILLKICLELSARDLRCARFCALATLAFSGFFRIGELLSLRRSDVLFFEKYLSVVIRSSKSDVYKQGKET